MYMTMTVMRPGLFFQREEPGSELGNSLGCPDAAACSVCGSLGGNQCRASLLHKQHKQAVTLDALAAAARYPSCRGALLLAGGAGRPVHLLARPVAQ